MANIVRWLFVIPAAIGAWYAVLVIGILTHSFSETALCPPADMVSDLCTNSRVQAFLDVLIHVFVGISCFAVGLSAVSVAPTHKIHVAWGTYFVGAAVAIYMGVASDSVGLAVTAVLVGLAGAVAITWFLRQESPDHPLPADVPEGPPPNSNVGRHRN